MSRAVPAVLLGAGSVPPRSQPTCDQHGAGQRDGLRCSGSASQSLSAAGQWLVAVIL